MKRQRFKWVIRIGVAVLALSLIWNWVSERTIHAFVVSAQENLMNGYAFISRADDFLTHKDKGFASLDAYEGIGYLQASSEGMNQIGVHGVNGLAFFFNRAMYSLLGYTNPGQKPDSIATKQHYQRVIQVFINSFKPLGQINIGSINPRQIQQAINLVYQAMTPQERQQFQGWS